MSDGRLGELRIRLKNVIVGTCNKVGCKSCDLKFEGGCSATEIENEIMDLEMKED